MVNTANSEHTPQWYLDRIGYLAGFMTPEREQILRQVLEQRTRYMTICLENTYHDHNASALVRHCDAFGVQDIYTIEAACQFRPSTRVVRGTDQWITFRRSESTAEAMAALRGAGYRIIATTPHHGDATPETFDVGAGPFALVFGTEHEGISGEVEQEADGFLRIPMAGFVESLNISASAAILVYMLSSRMRASGIDWRLREEEKPEILFTWMMRTLRHAEKILARYGK